ncbi:MULTISPECIES: hypothetical protein [Chryseobacterium]|uniref:hypothetical protein n=1 Tax=Chryseobacterium TaxID=59732 RepID=UPI0016297285|nr:MULTISPECIES: hypothetical protein [Chryseobacterium]MDR6922599.1 putative PurR-regulated permease PerM [Chryseobacterium sp. 2987]
MTNTNYISHFIRQLRLRKRILILLLVLAVFIIPFIFLVVAYKETNDLGKDLLGKTRYNERIEDAVKYTLAMMGLLTVMIVPLAFLLNRFFESYVPVLKSLEDDDIKKLKKYNESQALIHKYHVSFIFQKDTLHIFKLGRVNSIKGNSIISYNLEKTYGRGGHYRLRIKTADKDYFYIINNNDRQALMLEQDLAVIMNQTNNYKESGIHFLQKNLIPSGKKI